MGLRFLSYLGRWAREAGGGEGEMGGDQTSVGDEVWVRERGRSGRRGQLSFWGMKGVSGRKGVKWRGLTRCGGHQERLDVGAWCQRACEQRTVHWFQRLP